MRQPGRESSLDLVLHLVRRPDTAACMDWLTRVCNADTGDGVVEPAAVDDVDEPEVADNGGVVPAVDVEEVGTDALAPDTAVETGVVAILDDTGPLDKRIGTDRVTRKQCLADNTEVVWYLQLPSCNATREYAGSAMHCACLKKNALCYPP